MLLSGESRSLLNILHESNMSDTALFIAATDEELRSTSGLPGDLASLRNLAEETERIVHQEFLTDRPAPERLLNLLNQQGLLVSILPASGDPAATVCTGLMARLHEFTCTYPSVSKFILAGIQIDRLAPAAAFLQRAGFSVCLCGPDRNKLDALRFCADDTEVWSSGGRGGRSPRSEREAPADKASEKTDREDRSALDPFEVLVDEVTKSRKRGHRVLLTSLKQRMRKRIRRFDETRLKDKDGRPMRKFKDFIVDAANRGLIQLIEKGNLSHVLLPDEPADAGADEDDVQDSRDTQIEDGGEGGDDKDVTGVDPLLDTVDVVGGDSEDESEDDADSETGDDEAEAAPEEPPAEEPLTPDDLDPTEIDEEVSPPPASFLELLEGLLEKPLTLAELVQALNEKQSSGELTLRTRTLRDHVQAAFNNELLEAAGEHKPAKYALVDDWKDIIDYL